MKRANRYGRVVVMVWFFRLQILLAVRSRIRPLIAMRGYEFLQLPVNREGVDGRP